MTGELISGGAIETYEGVKHVIDDGRKHFVSLYGSLLTHGGRGKAQRKAVETLVTASKQFENAMIEANAPELKPGDPAQVVFGFMLPAAK